jgi:hypothetical protein
LNNDLTGRIGSALEAWMPRRVVVPSLLRIVECRWWKMDGISGKTGRKTRPGQDSLCNGAPYNYAVGAIGDAARSDDVRVREDCRVSNAGDIK